LAEYRRLDVFEQGVFRVRLAMRMTEMCGESGSSRGHRDRVVVVVIVVV